MKHFALCLAVFLSLNPLFAIAQTQPEGEKEAPQEVIVKYKNNEDIKVIDVGDPAAVDQAVASIEANPAVEYAEPNYSRAIFALPTNDPHVSEQWALRDTKIPEAWAISTGTDMTVAVIDIGIDYTHPDIVNRMWDGSSCVSESGVSIPGGCIHGYDFYNETAGDNDPMMPLPTEPNSNFAFHGTHVAGIIAAEYNNGLGITGIAPHVRVMALKFNLDVASEVRAIAFAERNGMKVINASYGGADFSETEYNAIKGFTDAGGIFVAAAGNSARSNDSSPTYPASYDLPGIISVAATDSTDNMASFSNFGATTVDIGAPGKSIISLYSTSTASGMVQSYAYADGTSMAAPQVTGLAALLWSTYPSLSAAEVKDRILMSGDALPALAGKTVSGRRVNALSALEATTTLPVAVLSNLPDATSTLALPQFAINVGGENITDYKYKFDTEEWSATTTVSTPISRTGLANGVHSVSVVGENSFGRWQSEASSTNYIWTVLDTTPPDLGGLADDSAGTQSKTWNWTSDDPSASFRFEVSSSSTPLALASSTYSEARTASASLPLGTVYIHVQARDSNGNESLVKTVSALLIAPPPTPIIIPPVSSGGGGGGGGGGSSASAAQTTLKIGDANGDGKVDILDFNSLMIHWSEHASPLIDFNSLMVHWAP